MTNAAWRLQRIRLSRNVIRTVGRKKGWRVIPSQKRGFWMRKLDQEIAAASKSA